MAGRNDEEEGGPLVPVGFGVLGPVVAWDDAGAPLALKGPRHRAVLARLLVARGRVVPVNRLVDDLWTDPEPGAVGTVRTFVAALRRALEPERPPRAPARLLVTEGPGYALRAAAGHVDAWRFEQAVTEAAGLPPAEEAGRLAAALDLWRGPAYAEFTDEHWAAPECTRLTELRLHAVERRAAALLGAGHAAGAVPDLEAHVAGHPWREEGWRLLALALYRTGRQADALAVLRRARALLTERLGVEPGPELRRLETDVLRQAGHLEADAAGPSGAHTTGRTPATDPTHAADQVWERATAAYERAVPPGARARLESTTGLLRNLAVTGGGGLEAARTHRASVVEAAERTGDPELTARVIGAYDVPAIWTRSDDPAQARFMAAAAERTLRRLPDEASEAMRARLLATIALEARGPAPTPNGEPRGLRAARAAEEVARRLDDPALLVFALNGLFMQAFQRTGLAARRDALGTELIAVSARHGLVTYEVLGHLIRMQARAALADFPAADRHADAADRLSARDELPLVAVFTRWYGALRIAAAVDPEAPVPLPDAHMERLADGRPEMTDGGPYRSAAPGPRAPQDPGAVAEAAYREAATLLDGSGMPGLERGLLPLVLLSLHVRFGRPMPEVDRTAWGPYEPWARPFVLLAQGREAEAATALRAAPEPPCDLLQEALWCLTGRAALAVGDRELTRRAYERLAPADGELAGAGSGFLTLGPVAEHLAALAAALDGTA